MGTQCMLKMTFSGKHQLLHQHLEADQEGTPHDQIQDRHLEMDTKPVDELQPVCISDMSRKMDKLLQEMLYAWKLLPASLDGRNLTKILPQLSLFSLLIDHK
ncbi:RING/U-box superfamily protein, partial [Striga asiatica]